MATGINTFQHHFLHQRRKQLLLTIQVDGDPSPQTHATALSRRKRSVNHKQEWLVSKQVAVIEELTLAQLSAVGRLYLAIIAIKAAFLAASGVELQTL